MSSINLSYYDVTRLDWKADSNESGAIDQSGNWSPLGFAENRVGIGIGESREIHYGNSQTIAVDKRVKKWGVYDIDYKLVKYSASPAWDWWDLIRYGFYGGATGAPVTRPSSVFLGAKLNYATPNYWTLSGCKHNQVQLKGSMVSGGLTCNIKGMSKYVRLDTNNYIQGTATALSDPTKTPIIPASDTMITINGVDETNNIQEWTLTMLRELEGRGRSTSVSGSSSQIAITGEQYREIVPNTFAARFECVIDPYGTFYSVIELSQ